MQRPSPKQLFHMMVGQNKKVMAFYLPEYYAPCSEEAEWLPVGRVEDVSSKGTFHRFSTNINSTTCNTMSIQMYVQILRQDAMTKCR